MRGHRTRRLVALCAISLCLAGAGRGAAANGMAETLDNYLLPIYPTVYGEIINALPPGDVANISTALRGVEFFGYLKSMGDVANALDAGDKPEAAMETASTLAKGAISYAQYQGVKNIAVMGSSVGMLPLTALVTAIDIARSSHKAVAASRIALDLERLYGSVEYDSEIRDSNRKLGEGDPIKVNPQTIERLWRKIIYDEKWAALFKTYVVNELNQDWPEPTLWERISIPSDVLRDAKLMEEQTRLKSHIASLLIELNKVAKKQEDRVVLAQRLRELSATALKVDPALLREAISKYHYAVGMLPGVSAYAADLPKKIDGYAKTIETGSATAIGEMRQEIMVEASLIVQYAKIIRAIPPQDSRAGGERAVVFRSLSESHARLRALLDGSSQSLINAKLVEDTKTLNVAGTEFVFKRYPVEKTFDDYARDFRDAVRNGTPQAAALVDAARLSIRQEMEKSKEQYGKDYADNNRLYLDKLADIDARLKALSEQLAATTDLVQQGQLRNAILNLQKVRADLRNRWEKYRELFLLTSGIDKTLLTDTLDEIDQFVAANANRYGAVEQMLGTFYGDAAAKLNDFAKQHSALARSNQAFLDLAELDRLEKLMADNPGGYVGIAPDFLSRHMPEVPSSGSRAQVLNAALDAMEKEIRHQMGVISSGRMTYYDAWNLTVLPSLETMASTAAADSLKNIEAAIDIAIRQYRSTPASEIRQSFKPTHAEHLKRLGQMLDSVRTLKKAAAKAVALAGQFEGYMNRAKSNNQLVDADGRFLSTLYIVFGMSSPRSVIALFNVKARLHLDARTGAVPDILPSRDILARLEGTDRMGVMEYSRNSGLGIEAFFAEPFVELATRTGMVSVTAADIDALRGRVEGLPTSSYAAFQPAMAKLIEESEVNGLFLRYIRVESFRTKFGFDGTLNAAIGKLADALVRISAAVQANQQVIDDAEQRFAAILHKITRGLDMASDAAAAGDYTTVAGLERYLADTWGEYQALGGRRADIDAAFDKFRALVEQARARLDELLPKTEPVPDTAAIQQLYQDFINAYGRGDLRGLLGLLSPNWQGGDGSDIRDVEEYLSNSFRIFDRIQYRISGFSVQSASEGRVQVSYSVRIIGENRRQRLNHEESSQVVEEVGLVAGKLAILRTLSGRQWLK
ncbi:MAG: hypothetical protein U1C96_04130 [Gallionella sp.]|nr:hypothetical protein [Gallionella sp.]